MKLVQRATNLPTDRPTRRSSCPKASLQRHVRWGGAGVRRRSPYLPTRSGQEPESPPVSFDQIRLYVFWHFGPRTRIYHVPLLLVAFRAIHLSAAAETPLPMLRERRCLHCALCPVATLMSDQTGKRPCPRMSKTTRPKLHKAHLPQSD